MMVVIYGKFLSAENFSKENSMKTILTLLLFLSTATLASSDPKKAYAEARAGKAIIVDVREFEEIKDGLIDKAVWLPMSLISQKGQMLMDFKDIAQGKHVYLYCKSGKRALRCQDMLRELGIESESIGGYDFLKTVLPTKKLFQEVHQPSTI